MKDIFEVGCHFSVCGVKGSQRSVGEEVGVPLFRILESVSIFYLDNQKAPFDFGLHNLLRIKLEL